jgi:hypothetical protein
VAEYFYERACKLLVGAAVEFMPLWASELMEAALFDLVLLNERGLERLDFP